MPLKSKLTPESRIRLLIALGPLSALAFILSVFLGRLHNPNLDFLSGFLVGFAIVGNLAYIFVTTRYMRNR
jgi:hypothetical protein